MCLQHGIDGIFLVPHAADSGIHHFHKIPHERVRDRLRLHLNLVFCLLDVLRPKLVQPGNVILRAIFVRDVTGMAGIIPEHGFQHIVRRLRKLTVHLLDRPQDASFYVVLLFFIQLIRRPLLFRMERGCRLVGITKRLFAAPAVLHLLF